MSTKLTAESSEAAAKTRISRQIDAAFESASQLAGSTLAPAEFYQKFLQETLQAIEAPAGAIWLRTPQGFLQIANQANLEAVGLDNKRGGRQCHNEVLRQVFQANPPRPVMIEPQGRLSGLGAPDANGGVPAANLTDFWALFAPIVSPDKSAIGLLEVFQDPSHDARMFPTFLNYTLQMAGYASQYHQFSNARQASGLEKVYTQVEAFAKVIHSSLNTTEVAYQVANEGRRLIECDRLSVGVRHGRKPTVEAVSGADVVEKASTHIRRMRILMDEVLKFGDKLVYQGEQDEALPPDLSVALDDYLSESQPKLLVIMPIRDEREKDNGKKARSVLLMESFNPPEQVEPLIQRMEVVGKHAAPALYNAAELHRIPFGFIWRPIGKIQDSIGGKHRFYWALGITAALLLMAAMVFIPYPLKMESKGEYLPVYVKQVFAPHEGEVRQILRKPGDKVAPGAAVVELFSPNLQEKYMQADAEAAAAEGQIRSLTDMLAKGNLSTDREMEIRQNLARHEATAKSRRKFQADMQRMYSLVPGQDGMFNATAEELDAVVRQPGAAWRVLSGDNREALAKRTVRPNEPLMRLGYTEGPWRVELKIPQRNIGHIAAALNTPGRHHVDEQNGKKYLDVDVLLTSVPDTSFRGRLYEDDIAGEAVPNRDDHNQSEPIIQAHVMVNIEGVPESQIPEQLFVAGQEVHTRIRCGEFALGYSLFHGVWEWFYEKVIFFF